MELSIVIVNWNSKEFLRRCIASILRETHELQFEIIVADAGSFDGCGDMLSVEFPHVKFLQLNENVGFGKANNMAYRLARGTCVLFLNPDTELIGPAIAQMQRAIRTLPNAGAIGAKLLNTDGTLQTSCIQAIPTILNQLLSCEYLRQKWPHSRLWGMSPLYTTSCEPQEVEAISGACVMTNRTAFDQVGRFSEDYFMYAEDIDLSQKFRVAGYRNYYIPEATVLHHGGGSSGDAASRFAVVMARESMWRFLRKSRGHIYALAYRASLFAAAVGRILIGLVAYSLRPSARARNLAACVKWLAVLGWSLGCDRSFRRFHSV